MGNSTALTFTLTAYAVLEEHKRLFFALLLALYAVTVFLNALLVGVVGANKGLQQPMNLFACMLCSNELLGSSALLLPAMRILLSQTFEMSAGSCVAQVYFLHTYASSEFCILALLGYDRFVAICRPLRYHALMSSAMVGRLAALVGLYPFVAFGALFSLTARLSFCGEVIEKLYCVNMELVKNACSDGSRISIVGLAFVGVLIVPQMIMICFSYAQILRACKKFSKQSQAHALKRCAPHICSCLNYSIAGLFEIIQNRFDMSHVAIEARIFLSIYFAVIPPLTNPVLYGLGTHLVRVHLIKMCIKYKILPSKRALAT